MSNGCKCSKISVHPKNWNKPGASLQKDWYISFRIYSPGGGFKQHQLKGMNWYKTLDERRQATKEILEELKYEVSKTPEQEYVDSTRSMPFMEALRMALSKMTYVQQMMVDKVSVLNGIEKAAKALRLSHLQISEISRKHIKLLCEHQFVINKRFTPKRFNRYLSYLSPLFNELVEMEAIEYNPTLNIKKMRVLHTLRKVLSREERIAIDRHLKEKCYRFWLFTNIFFHSGGRETELMSLKKQDVRLSAQKYRCIVKKGKQYREVERTIKDVALPYWIEVLQGCGPGQFLFSKNLLPGDKQIRTDQITRRWFKYVKAPKDKGGLGITVDFYALKHSNTDETSALIGLELASKHNSHTNTAVTRSYYAVGEKEREHEILKKVGNTFA